MKKQKTVYLAQAVLNHEINSLQLFIMSASDQTRSNRDLNFENKLHEEADTIMICLASKASQLCPNAELVFRYRCFGSGHRAL